MIYKLEIIYSEITNCTYIELYEFKKKCFFSLEKYHIISRYSFGHKWRSPQVRNLEELIKKEIQPEIDRILKREGEFEIHRTTITKSESGIYKY